MQKKCKHCQTEYRADRRNSVYCTESCRNKAYYNRKVESIPNYAQLVSGRRKLAIEKEIEIRNERVSRLQQQKKEEEQSAIEKGQRQKLEFAEQERLAELERKQRAEARRLRIEAEKEQRKRNIESLIKGVTSFLK